MPRNIKLIEFQCDHCGQFASMKHQTLYTLYGVNHPHCEDVGVCLKCSRKYSSDYWLIWLNKRFASAVVEHDTTDSEVAASREG